MMEAAGEARGKDSVLGVHMCVCSVQGHEGQAMFRVRVCVLGIAILFPCTSGWRHSTMIKPKHILVTWKSCNGYTVRKRIHKQPAFLSPQVNSTQGRGWGQERSVGHLWGELKEAKRCRISKTLLGLQ